MSTRAAFLSSLLLALLLLPWTVSAAGDEPGAPPFGFSGMRILKLDGGGFGLAASDFDGDGIADLAVVNNAKARIDLYLSRPGGAPAAKPDEDAKPNDLPEDARVEKKEVLTEKEVTSFVVADLNGDGRVDLAFYGKPKELVVLAGNGDGSFVESRTFPVTDGAEGRGALAAGDLNGDGRADLALLTEKQVALVLAREDGTLSEPVRVPRAVAQVSALGIADLDGDGRKDLLQFAAEHPRPVRVRFQESDGTLGPEIGLSMPPFRTIDVRDLVPGGGAEILAVPRTSGLFRMMALSSRTDGEKAGELGSLRIFPFADERSSKPRRLAVGDLDGDGRNDVVVTEPGTAQVALYRQAADGRLASPRLYPSLSETEAIAVADLDGDGRAEVAVLSGKEDAVGISTLDAEGRLPFPRSLTVAGKPRAMAAGDLDGDGKPDLVVVTKGETWQARVFSGAAVEPRVVDLPGLDPKRDDADALTIHDIDQDGRADLLLYDRYKMIRAFTANPDGSFANAAAGADYAGSLVEKKSPADTAVADLTGDGKPEFLVASQNFARGFVLEKGRLTVKDQVNARGSGSRIQCVAAADLDGDGSPEVLFLDGDGNVLTRLSRGKAGVYEAVANQPIGDFAFEGLTVAELNGDGVPDVIVLGRDRFGVLYSGASEIELREVSGFESVTKDGYLYGFAIGDLNADGRPDLAIADTRNNMIELKWVDEKGQFHHGLKWRVFQEKMHEPRRSGGEPRELVTGDFDGDGRVDLAILVHDRLILYRQDD